MIEILEGCGNFYSVVLPTLCLSVAWNNVEFISKINSFTTQSKAKICETDTGL